MHRGKIPPGGSSGVLVDNFIDYFSVIMSNKLSDQELMLLAHSSRSNGGCGDPVCLKLNKLSVFDGLLSVNQSAPLLLVCNRHMFVFQCEVGGSDLLPMLLWTQHQNK